MVQRILVVDATNKVTNVIGYPDGVAIPDMDAAGNTLVPAVTNTETPNDTFDLTDTLLERRINRQDVMIYRELFRLTNAVRILELKGQLTLPQDRAFLKTQG